MRVLLTYARHPKTLAALRSIGGSGRDALATDYVPSPGASFSKHCRRFFMTGSPGLNQNAYLDSIARVVDEERINLIIPMDDPECDLFVNTSIGARVGAIVALPSKASYERCRDKAKTVALAEQLGIPVPKTFLVRDYDSLSQIGEVVGFPAIVKPLRSSGSRGFIVLTGEESLKMVSNHLDTYKALLAQEFIPSGGGIGVSCLMNHGDARAVFVHRRVLEYPETGGPSIVRVSARNPEAEASALHLLRELHWHGIAMVEFRIDSRTGKPMLMEINPRFWGSLPLAVAAGVNFPKLLCDMYEFGDVDCSETYAEGVGCVNLLPFGASSVLGEAGLRRLAKVLRWGVKFKHFDVESFDDPLPTVGTMLFMVKSTLDPANIEMFFRR